MRLLMGRGNRRRMNALFCFGAPLRRGNHSRGQWRNPLGTTRLRRKLHALLDTNFCHSSNLPKCFSPHCRWRSEISQQYPEAPSAPMMHHAWAFNTMSSNNFHDDPQRSWSLVSSLVHSNHSMNHKLRTCLLYRPPFRHPRVKSRSLPTQNLWHDGL